MANANKSLQVKDVYDCASDIFQEFEKIITITGIDDASTLINKVKNVLELLEESVHKFESLDKDYADVKTKCSQLNNDKLFKENEMKDLKQAFEELEESWNKESLNLKSLLNKLRAENKILQHKLAEKKDMPLEVESSFKTVIEEQENIISKLKSNLSQKETRHEKDQAVIESLKEEIHHLNKINTSLYIQYQKAQDTISTLKKEKNESVEELNNQGEKLHQLEDNFDELKKTIAETCEFSLQNMLDVYKPLKEEQNSNEEKLKILYQEQKKLKQEVKDLKLELTLLKIQMDEYEKEFCQVGNEQNVECLQTHGHLDQIYRLFLGVNAVSPQACILRNKRMHS